MVVQLTKIHKHKKNVPKSTLEENVQHLLQNPKGLIVQVMLLDIGIVVIQIVFEVLIVDQVMKLDNVQILMKEFMTGTLSLFVMKENQLLV